MIKKTNGNLFDMISAVKHLCNNVEILNIDEYSSFMLNYIDNEINKDPLLTGMIIPERKLYISPKHWLMIIQCFGYVEKKHNIW